MNSWQCHRFHFILRKKRTQKLRIPDISTQWGRMLINREAADKCNASQHCPDTDGFEWSPVSTQGKYAKREWKYRKSKCWKKSGNCSPFIVKDESIAKLKRLGTTWEFIDLKMV